MFVDEAHTYDITDSFLCRPALCSAASSINPTVHHSAYAPCIVILDKVHDCPQLLLRVPKRINLPTHGNFQPRVLLRLIHRRLPRRRLCGSSRCANSKR